MKDGELKNWVVLQINCDCAGYYWARTRIPNACSMGPRCRGCGKPLGPMQWRFVARVKAKSEWEAIKEAKVRKRLKRKQK